MTTNASIALELDDIQAGVLRPRPNPYAGAYFLLRIDERRAGRELLRRLIPALASAADAADPNKPAWLSLALTYQGLTALGSIDVHVVLTALAPDAPRFQALLARAREALHDLPGVVPIWRQDVASLPGERDAFGFKDGISQPAVEGSGMVGTNPHEAPLKAGEFVLGYADETGDLRPPPQPAVLGRNGTYMVVRKLHTRVAAFRQYLRERAASPADEE